MRTCFVLLALLLAAAPARAADTKKPGAEKTAAPALDKKLRASVAEIVEKSGARGDMEELSKSMIEQVGQFPGITDESKERVRKAVAQHVAPQVIFDRVVDALTKDAPKKDVPKVKSFFDGPLGKKVASSSIDATSPEQQQEVAAFVEKMPGLPPERTKAVDRLVVASDGERIFVRKTVEPMLALLGAFKGKAGQTEGADAQQMAAIFDMLGEQMRQNVTAQAPQMTRVLYAYKFRELTPKQLDEISTFYESPAGKWFNTALHDELISALTDGVGKLGGELVKEGTLEQAPGAEPPPPGFPSMAPPPGKQAPAKQAPAKQAPAPAKGTTR